MDNSDGTRSTIESKYHRGERTIWSSRKQKNSWLVDGYAHTDHGIKVYEFNGRVFHQGCEFCHKKSDATWTEKKEDIYRAGYKLEFICECQFDKLVPKIRHIKTPLIPQILNKYQSETELLDGIKSGSLFGFIECDVFSPPDVVEKLKAYPPVIRRETITDRDLSDYMRKRVKLEKPDENNFQRTTLIQCFNAKNHLLITPLVQYYLTKGMKITNVSRFIQFIPRKSLLPFVEKVTNMRIDAEKNNLPMKGNTAKQFGNNGYGRVRIYFDKPYFYLIT